MVDRFSYVDIELNDSKIYVYKMIAKVYFELVEKKDTSMYEPIMDLIRQDLKEIAIKNNIDTSEKLEVYLLQQILNYSRANPDDYHKVLGGTF